MIDETPLTGEPLPLELVNTTFIKGGVRGEQVDVLTSPAELDQWLVKHEDQLTAAVLEPCEPRHLARFLDLRTALRGLAGALVEGRAPEPGHVRTVNSAARLGMRWPELDAGFDAVPKWPEPDPRLVALGEVAAEGVTLLGGDQAGRVRACPAPGCILFFVKAHARREWCTAGCGNRVRVARHGQKARGRTG